MFLLMKLIDKKNIIVKIYIKPSVLPECYPTNLCINGAYLIDS